jgi:cytochrome c551/c552
LKQSHFVVDKIIKKYYYYSIKVWRKKEMKKSKLLMVALLSSTIALTACQKKEETPATGEAQPAPQQQAQQPQQATETKQEVKEEAKSQEQKPEEKKEEKKQESAKPKEEAKQQTAKVDGEAIFKSKGCTACHQSNADTVGPGLNKIASAYKGNKDGLVKFLNGEGKAIVDPAKEAVMKPNLEITRKLSKEEKEALAEFILKH